MEPLTIDQAVLIAIIAGICLGAIFALGFSKSQIKIFKAAEAKKWGDLINLAMTNAYTAGYADGKGEGKKRPVKEDK
jgi:hypothetical protein